MSIKDKSYQELTSLLMLDDISSLSVDEIMDALDVVSSEIDMLREKLNEVQATQLFYVNNITTAKEAHNEGELTFNYNKMMQEEKTVYELESAIADCQKLQGLLNSALDEKNIDMPKIKM